MKKNNKNIVASKGNTKKSKHLNINDKMLYLIEISDFIQKYSVLIAPLIVIIVYF
jgi:hypothetical protein